MKEIFLVKRITQQGETYYHTTEDGKVTWVEKNFQATPIFSYNQAAHIIKTEMQWEQLFQIEKLYVMAE